MGNYLSPDTCTLTVYSMSEVAKHNRINDGWMVIDGKVYDVSTFKHPGGNIINMGYGKDATELFHNKHIRHSNRAKTLVKKYLIGKLEEIPKS